MSMEGVGKLEIRNSKLETNLNIQNPKSAKLGRQEMKRREGNMGKQWIAALLISVNLLLLSISDFAYAKSEADWFYEAAVLEKRFETISAAQIPYAQKTQDYYKLLDHVNTFAAGVAPADLSAGASAKAEVPPGGTKEGPPAQMSDRETRGRKAFALLCTGWIQQMLANTEVANKTQSEYKEFLDTMPESERVLVTTFFEKQYQKATPVMPRVCNVEAKGRLVRVVAADWPLRDLLLKMADAAGVKVTIPKEVNGLVDYPDVGWRAVDAAIGPFLISKGLIMNDRFTQEAVAPLRVLVVDPLYTASIGERADKRVTLKGLVKPPNGVDKGYVLMHGFYVPGPYVIETRVDEGMLQVCINGVPVDKGNAVSLPTRRQAVPLSQANTLSDFSGAVYSRFGELNSLYGATEAARRLQDELNHHPMVKSARVSPHGEGAQVTLKDGLTLSFMLYKVLGLGREDLGHSPTEVADRANQQRKNIEDTLRTDGLVFIAHNGAAHCYGPEDARRKLIAVCDVMQEIARYRDSLCGTLYTFDWTTDAYASAWEVMLNLRYRDLLNDLDSDSQQETGVQQSGKFRGHGI